MQEQQVRDALVVVFEAIKTGKFDRLDAAIHPSTYWELPGKSRFAGHYVGPEVCARFIARRRAASPDRFQPFGEDIAITPFHGVLMFAVRTEVAGQQLMTHEIVVAGYGEEHIEAIHHYIYELDAFDAFWPLERDAGA
jgi:hypothetical protein